MTDCIFCDIVDGEIPSYTVHEDEAAMAFLDANPLARGHTLVIPKAHYERVTDLPADLATDVFAAVHDRPPGSNAPSTPTRRPSRSTTAPPPARRCPTSTPTSSPGPRATAGGRSTP